MSAPTASVKEAALAVHGLSSDDRRKVLARLTDTQRATIEPLLIELRALGVPASVARRTTAPRTRLLAAGDEPLMRLSPSDAAAALGTQSPATICAVLNAADWPWRADALSLLEATRRRAVEELLRDATLHTAAARAAWIDTLRHAVGGTYAESSSSGHRAHWIRRISSWML
jgi:hypothetical protein